MKAMVCEMCGSQELIKNDGVFVCNFCGTKYSVEEARKMMIDGTVDVKGTVKVDTSEELKNLYQAARTAREASDAGTALKHYEKISTLDPNSWEATFYLVTLKCHSITNAQIASAANKITNSLKTVFSMVSTNLTDDEEKKKAVKEIALEVISTSIWLSNASYNFFKSVTKGDGLVVSSLTGGIGGAISSINHSGKATDEDQSRQLAIANMVLHTGDCVSDYCDMNNGYYQNIAVRCWERGLEMNNEFKAIHGIELFAKDGILGIITEIKKYKHDYEAPTTSKTNNGCYVATAVYGSYDCPEVWTLRRFRDYTLSETWHGRAFIKTYYAISPTLVKWFGHTVWFKKMWKGKLDRMVSKLQSEGIESTPYRDKNW